LAPPTPECGRWRSDFSSAISYFVNGTVFGVAVLQKNPITEPPGLSMRTIVHLSDLHFGRFERRILTPLVQAVVAVNPDLVAVSGDFTVDLTTVASDDDRRDNQFHGRIMNTGTFPTATFVLGEPVDFGSVPGDLEQITVPVSGQLTMHGVTNDIAVDLLARRNGAGIEVNGTIPIAFSDYDINNPSGGPAQVGDDGEIELLLILTRT